MAFAAFDPPVPVFALQARGYPRTDGEEPGVAEYGPFSAAAREAFGFDAYFTQYSLPLVPHRLSGTAALDLKPKMVLWVVDVDGPGHIATEEWWAETAPKIERLIQRHGRCYVYRTRGGARIVYALEPFEMGPGTAERWSASYLAWLDYLRTEFQIDGDTKCADWTRVFRLPRVVRDGKPTTPLAEIGEPDRLGVWRVPMLPADDPRCQRRAPVAPPPSTPAPVSDEALEKAALALIAAWPPRGKHRASLALCGALASLGWADDAIADFVTAVCGMADDNDGDYDKRLSQARSSAERVFRGETVAGWGTLKESLATGTDGLLDPDRQDAANKAVDAATKALGIVSGWKEGFRVDLFQTLCGHKPSATAPTVESAVAAIAESDSDFAAMFATASQEMTAAMAATGSEGAALGPLGMTSRALHASDTPPPQWLVRDLITRGGVGVLGAEAKSAKTWLATEVCLGITSGTPVLGQFAVDRPGHVFYFCAEDFASSVKTRQKALMRPRNLAADGWLDRYMVQPRGRVLDLTQELDCALLIASCRQLVRSAPDGKPDALGPDLLVLDPFSDVHSAEEDKRDSMKPLFQRLRAMATLMDCGIMFVHHTGKATADGTKRRPGQRLRGSSVIHGAVDFGLYLDNLRGDGRQVFTNLVTSEVKGARSAGKFDLTLTITDDANGTATDASYEISEPATGKEDTEAVAIERVQDILQRLFDHGAPLTRDALKRKIGGGTDVLSKSIEKAIKERLIEQCYNGGRPAGYQLTEAGREAVRFGGAPTTPPVKPAAPTAPPVAPTFRLLGGVLSGIAARRQASGSS